MLTLKLSYNTILEVLSRVSGQQHKQTIKPSISKWHPNWKNQTVIICRERSQKLITAQRAENKREVHPSLEQNTDHGGLYALVLWIFLIVLPIL